MQTAWECIFLHLWATGRLEYVPDYLAFSSWDNAIRTIGGIFLVPLYRDLHFYFAHRFIHLRALYKYIHSLHHRNTIIEPFSGLSMHPVEHLYYVSCMSLNLYFRLSPLHLMANGLHLTLSPAASHSGWEDNWQSDQFHYLHHAKFECNYGTTAVPYDKWFGTYQEVFVPPEQIEKQRKITLKKSYFPTFGDSSISDAIPSAQNAIYFGFTAILFLVTIFCLVNEKLFFLENGVSFGARVIALSTAISPLFFAAVLWYLSADSFQFLWPFHKENPLVLGGNLLVSGVLCVLPVYHLILCALSSGTSGCTIWGKC